MKSIQVGIAGCGRVAGLASYLVKSGGITIRGGFDPLPGKVKAMLEQANNPNGIAYNSFQDLINDPEIEWVMIGSPNAFHREQVVTAFEKGKNVFSEKPLATTVADCEAMVEAHRKSGKLFATGFCMRYSPLYRKAKEILDSGILGRIISVDANENINPGHGAYIFANWRRNKEIAGPHILEKCVHDLDLLNWFTGSIPSRVAAFGGNNMFIPENRKVIENAPSFLRLKNCWDAGVDPFLVEKTIEDNLVAILEFHNGMRAQFQATTSNAMPERRMYFSCTAGNLIIEQYSATLKYQPVSEKEPHVIRFDSFHDAHLEGYQKVHAEGDWAIMRELAETMKTGVPPKCSGQEGMLSSVSGIMIDRSRVEGKILDLTETWRTIGVETDKFRK